MGTHDKFKTKIDSIPKSEFSFLITGQQSSPPRSPTETRDGIGIFRSCDVSHVGTVDGGGDGVADDGCDGEGHAGYGGGVGLEEGMGFDVVRAAGFGKEAVLVNVEEGGGVVVDAFSF